MNLFNTLSKTKTDIYLKNIENMAKFSGLFASDSAAPFLVSRSTEKIFCDSLGAKDLSRDDTAIDATLGIFGIGVKTFLHNNGNTLQKIAEFNRDSSLYRDLAIKDKVHKIATLRNQRLQFALDNYGVDKLMYHCITRDISGTIAIYEKSMDFINIDSIKDIKMKQNSISFRDDINEYNFNLTKSTLFQRFDFKTDQHLVSRFKVKIIKDPYTFLANLLDVHGLDNQPMAIQSENPSVLLPLYSFSKSNGKYIPPKSGLNQWNAEGRKRHENEAYIPISRKIHKKFPGFFPSRDVVFPLHLPNQKTLSAKISQDSDKALMTNPNKDLGKWLLRDILKLDSGTLLTYDALEAIGVDSVRIEKHPDGSYSIDFCPLGSYDQFAAENDI